MTKDKDVIGAYKPGDKTFKFVPVGKAMAKPPVAKKAMTPKAKKK